MILTPEQARRKTVAACQAALTRRGVAVLVVPIDVANADAHGEWPYTVHVRRPLIRPSDPDLDEIADILNNSKAITIFAGAGCEGAHDEVVATAARLKAPMAHTSRGKDFVEYDNPYNVGMTGMIGGAAGYHAVLDCDVLLRSVRISPGPSSIRIARPSFRLMPIPPISDGGIRWRSGPSVMSRPHSTPCCHASRNTITTGS
jgi:pyruvate dehydrogenase (quinone)